MTRTRDSDSHDGLLLASRGAAPGQGPGEPTLRHQDTVTGTGTLL